MEQKPEGLQPQNPAGGTPPQGDEVITLSKKELEDLKHKADVSSQNFERAKKAEDRVKELTDALSDPLLNPPEEGEIVKKLQEELNLVKAEQAKTRVIEAHPQLREVWKEFEQFREAEDNKGMNLNTAAKVFLTEKGLLDPQRKGLEKPTGGTRTPPKQGMTVEEIRNLRETNFKQYRELVKKGIIV